MWPIIGLGPPIRSIAVGAMVLFVLTDCSPTPRLAMTEAQQGKASFSDVSLSRFWGDEVTPDIQTAIERQYRQVADAAARSIRPASVTRADFLAISGGGSDGAFAGGVLSGWSTRGDRPEFEVVTGVSTGALAAPFAFLGTAYDAQLADIYTSYGDADIMRSRGLIGVFGTALNDNAPLRALIFNHMNDQVLDAIAAQYRLGRRLLVQTTNIDAQRPVIWDISAICASGRQDRRELVVDILLASAAIPAVFPPVRLRVKTDDGEEYDELHVDGGVSAQVFFAPPNIRLGDFERKIFGHARKRTLYVIRNGRLNPQYETTVERTIPIAQRAIETLTRYQGVADLTRLETLARRGNARLFYVAIPGSFNAMAKTDFDRTYMRALFQQGVQVGVKGDWLNMAPVTPVLAEVAGRP